MGWYGDVGHGKLCSGGLGTARCGRVSWGRVGHGLAVVFRCVLVRSVRHVGSWQGGLGLVRFGRVRSGWARWGVAWRSGFGELRRHRARRVMAGGRGMLTSVKAGLGMLWSGGRGDVMRGGVRSGGVWRSWFGSVCQGWSRRGKFRRSIKQL